MPVLTAFGRAKMQEFMLLHPTRSFQEGKNIEDYFIYELKNFTLEQKAKVFDNSQGNGAFASVRERIALRVRAQELLQEAVQEDKGDLR